MYNGGTVCDDSFNDKTADWICRMMGYESLNQWYHGAQVYYWQNSYSIMLDEVVCTGDIVPNCRYITSHNCGHSEDVWLHCHLREQLGDLNSFYQLDSKGAITRSGNGLLMYKGGTVCKDGFSNTAATWICQLMGYETLVNWNYGRQASFQNTLTMKIDNLECSSGVYSDILPSCSSDGDTNEDTHAEDVWVWCSSRAILECPQAHRYHEGVCEECPPSTYYPTPNSGNSCLPCPAYSNSTAGSSHCICEGGHYLSAGLDTCLKCPRDKVSKEGSNSLNHCVHCPVGSEPVDDGKRCSCKAGHGWIWTTREEGTCSPCPMNFYKHKIKGVCQECPAEATSLFLSEDCLCSSGLSWDGEACVDCIAEDSVSGVCGCKAGTFWNGYTSTCEGCPKNHYSEDHSQSCTKCPRYTISFPNSAECTSCPVGHFWEEFTCKECPDQHIGMKNACFKCPEGTSLSTDKTMCLVTKSIDFISVTSLTMSLIFLLLILALFIWTKFTSRNIHDPKLVYRNNQATLEISDRRCMCPDCPCTDNIRNRPALPPRGVCTQDDVYANFQN